ncbi:MAG: hypothetical protein LKKZDAJK_001938 [Candidatus Fervidibacter sp.]
MPQMLAEFFVAAMMVALISGLMGLRLVAGGANARQATQIIGAVWVLAAAFVGSVATAVTGWRAKSWSTLVSMALGVTAFLLLRRVLRGAWERFPLE